MDPFRVGIVFVAVAGGLMILSAALPSLVRTLLDIVPSLIILAVIIWVLRAFIQKLLS